MSMIRGRIDQEFIRQRIQEFPDRRFALLVAGDVPVQEIGNGSDTEDESGQETGQGRGPEKTDHDKRNG